MKFLPISSMFSQLLLRLYNCKHKTRSFRGRTSILLTGSNVKQSNFCRLNRSASALGAQNMDVESRSAPTLPVKPTRRSTQVGLFQSQQGSSSFCLHNSLIKTGLSLYLHVTFSLKETFRIDGVYAVWVLKGTQNWQCDLFFSHLYSVWFCLCRLPLPPCWLPGSYIHLGEASEACGQTSRYCMCVVVRGERNLSNKNVFVFLYAATFTCQVCKKVFKKMDLLRRHKRIHASQKPVLVCPREDCQAYFSTTFNLQHHIRKVHLNLLKYKCPFPDCPRMFAMRVSKRSLTGSRRRLQTLKFLFIAIVWNCSGLSNRRAWADICFIMTQMQAFRRFVSHNAAVNGCLSFCSFTLKRLLVGFSSMLKWWLATHPLWVF